MKSLNITLILCLFGGSAHSLAQEDNPPVSDGPYVFYQDEGSAKAFWVCKDKVHEQQVALTKGETISACDLPADLSSMNNLPQVVEHQGNFNIVALSDMHGQYALSRELLRNNGVIDKRNNWAIGNSHLVITGDVFDRGEQVTEILWMLYKLEQQAEKVGGKLHLLLGNHEVMILNGDLRYLHPKYVKVAKLLKRNFTDLFDETSVLGQWLRSKSVLVKLNGYLFAHGGFHPELAQHNLSLQDINQLFKANLIKSQLSHPRQGWGRYVHKSNGPIWYRGYFKDDGATDTEIELLLKHFDVKKIIVGHTSQKKIETRYDGKVIAIDSSIKRGKYGELLFIEKLSDTTDLLYRGTLSGNKIRLDSALKEAEIYKDAEGVLFE